ncbi:MULTISPECIES: ABC transporter ATP-binding protein [unclassified Lactococcus]|uniref:ABC transporter ATP-binding protein n=1 Tax=unclassified Lactococcus TaxID=2643510 RepID=UPI0011C9DA09|nr:MULTISPECIES: ABC transporter ATP-binding protein [unclassified Lactococcus]MQW23238.1 ATP-binding cassette domain-containing protein [Lactococcus sp. dk101]TXK38093.1 ABC transporter ATP-binding protein [Lactococcus sp. dk310]TXK49772.1 ABC transporter ATP-binding protein [Lactococcus sp. dk322]
MLNIGRHYLQPWPVFWALFFLVIQVMTNLWLPSITADIINKGIAQQEMSYIWKMGAVMLLIALASWISALVNVYFASKQSQRLGRNLRQDVFKKVMLMDDLSFADFGDSTLITRTTNDVTQLQNVFQTMLRMMLMAPMMLIGSIFMAWHLSQNLMLVFAVSLPLLTLAVVINMAIAIPRFRVMQTLVDKINLVFQQGLTGVRVIRAFNRDDFEQEKFDAANRDLTQTSRIVLTTVAMLMPIMTVILSFTNLGIVWFGAKLIGQGMMPMGNLVAFLTYASQILMSFMQLSAVAVMVPRAQVSAIRVCEVLGREEKMSNPGALPKNEISATGSALAFEQVTYKFDQAERLALSALTFEVEAGQTLAIIGGTGAGKTTLVQLMGRFMDVTTGRILLNGVDIRQLTLHELYDRISIAQQKAVLFSGTVQSNLYFGKPDATDEEMWQALEIAQAADFVRQQGGLKMSVEQNGANFSGGQRQRLSIARSLIKPAQIYLFDDSFSALDFATDAKLRQAISASKAHQNAIKIIMAQRIATVMNADKILVLENGQVSGFGSHAELSKTCLHYQEILRSQLSDQDLQKMGLDSPDRVLKGGQN